MAENIEKSKDQKRKTTRILLNFYFRQNMTTILAILLERETLGKFIKTKIKNEYKNIRKRHKRRYFKAI